jgi:hypothetical protein
MAARGFVKSQHHAQLTARDIPQDIRPTDVRNAVMASIDNQRLQATPYANQMLSCV